MPALGLIETLGLIGTAEAAEAMVKAAAVTIERYEKIGAGYSTTLIRGEVGAVQDPTREALRAKIETAAQFTSLKEETQYG